MDAESRRCWRLLEALPARLGPVRRWFARPRDRAIADGQLHAVPTMIIALAGVVRVQRHGERLGLRAGEALLLAPGVWHRHEAMRPGSVWFGQGFLGTWSDIALGGGGRDWYGKLPSQPSRRLLDAALAAADADRCRGLVLDLLRQVLAESVDDQTFGHPAMMAMLTTMWSRLHAGARVEDLVRASGLSRAQAYRVFAAGYGMPPREALATNRLWLAQGLLGAGLPVAEVARRCGYPSAGTFTRAWKRAHGRPPGRMTRPARR